MCIQNPSILFFAGKLASRGRDVLDPPCGHPCYRQAHYINYVLSNHLTNQSFEDLYF